MKYAGLSAHAGNDPWDGINALDGAVGAYMNVSLLRQQMMPQWRVTGETRNRNVSRTYIEYWLCHPRIPYRKNTARYADKSYEVNK